MLAHTLKFHLAWAYSSSMSKKQYAHNGLAGCVSQFRSRDTRTLVGLYNCAQAGLEDNPETPWCVVCEEHHTLVCVESLRRARQIRSPREFCEACNADDSEA